MDQNQIQSRIRDAVVKNYPGVFNFSREQVAQLVGCSAGHLANLESKGSPLIPCVKLGKKPLYQLPDIVDFLMQQRGVASLRRRGPRTKADRMTAAGVDSHLTTGGGR
jgi:hypothetical protein